MAGDALAAEILRREPSLPVVVVTGHGSVADAVKAMRSGVTDYVLKPVSWDEMLIAVEHALVVGATSHPDGLRPAFLAQQRFERVVEVNPIVPDDVVAALLIHKTQAEKRAGRALFEPVIDWQRVVGSLQGPTTGEWVRVLHAVLRRKARCEAAGEIEPSGSVATSDLLDEVERLRRTKGRLPEPASGIEHCD